MGDWVRRNYIEPCPHVTRAGRTITEACASDSTVKVIRNETYCTKCGVVLTYTVIREPQVEKAKR